MRYIKWYAIVVLMILTLVGCQSWQTFSPDEILEKALAATEEPETSYYGEMIIKESGEKDELNLDKTMIKEWYDGNRSRSEIVSPDAEMIIIQNGSTMQTYDLAEATIFEMEIAEMEELSFNPKEQVNHLLMILADTHHVETIGKEEVNGRPTHHLQASVRDGENSLLGDLELWIDEEYWLPLRTKTKSGDIELEMEYVKIDFDATFTDDLFTLEVPEGVKVESISDPFVEESIAKDELGDVFEEKIYYIAESAEWEIDQIRLTDGDSNEHFTSTWLEIDYLYKGLPSVSLTIASNEDGDASEHTNEEMLEVFGDLAEVLAVRDTEALLIDSSELYMISWFENGFDYTIDVLDQSIATAELLDVIEAMTQVK